MKTIVIGIGHHQKTFQSYKPVLGRVPANRTEISRPRLKAWLKTRRVWKVDMKGNHDNDAIGMKRSVPIAASKRRAIARTEFHNPAHRNARDSKMGLMAIPICHPKTIQNDQIFP